MLKKQFLALIVFSVNITTYASPFKNKEEALNVIVNLHNRVFGVDNLIKQKLDLQPWKLLTNRINDQVKKDGSIAGIKDNTIHKAWDTIQKANDALMSVLDNTYQRRARGGDFILANAQKELTQATGPRSGLVKLRNERFTLDSKKRLIDILLNFTLFIDTTITKAIKDIRAAGLGISR